MNRSANGFSMLATALVAMWFASSRCSCAESVPASVPEEASSIPWQVLTPDTFAQARREQRFVILDLEAEWCHWCHVMEATTYRDPEVVRLIAARYLPVRVNQEQRPDLANRYEDYGWPATVIFAADGSEIAVRSGYIPPERMMSLLQAIIDDPSPGPSVVPPPSSAGGAESLPAAQRAELEADYRAAYDRVHGGWGTVHKYLDADAIEYGLVQGGAGDAGRMALETLAHVRTSLLDPAWGGLYQYSAGGGWEEPHFEKIMAVQTDGLRCFSLTYARDRDPAWRDAAEAIHRYLTTFLRAPDGAFFTSQDADLVQGEHAAGYFALDDSARRALGMPRVDRHRYTRENGWAIRALVAYANAIGDPAILDEARITARWALAHRQRPDGAFMHDDAAVDQDVDGAYLGDSVAMAQALMALWIADGDSAWRMALERTLAAIDGFADPPGAGYRTARGDPASRPQRDENVALARCANAYARCSGDQRWRAMALRAFSFISAPAIASRRPAASALLVADELGREPVHAVAVGDPTALQPLITAALGLPTAYLRIDRWDPASGPWPGPGEGYPADPSGVMYLCIGDRCLAPARDAAALRASYLRAMGGD